MYMYTILQSIGGYGFDGGLGGGGGAPSSGYSSLGGQNPQQMSHNLMMMSSMTGVVPPAAARESSPAIAQKKAYGCEQIMISLSLLCLSQSFSLCLFLSFLSFPLIFLFCSLPFLCLLHSPESLWFRLWWWRSPSSNWVPCEPLTKGLRPRHPWSWWNSSLGARGRRWW